MAQFFRGKAMPDLLVVMVLWQLNEAGTAQGVTALYRASLVLKSTHGCDTSLEACILPGELVASTSALEDTDNVAGGPSDGPSTQS